MNHYMTWLQKNNSIVYLEIYVEHRRSIHDWADELDVVTQWSNNREIAPSLFFSVSIQGLNGSISYSGFSISTDW
jgi:hypothetical protein